MRKEVHDNFLMQMMSYLRELAKQIKEKEGSQQTGLNDILSTDDLIDSGDFSSLWTDLQVPETIQQDFTNTKEQDLFSVSRFDKDKARSLIQFFKQLLLFSIIFLK